MLWASRSALSRAARPAPSSSSLPVHISKTYQKECAMNQEQVTSLLERLAEQIAVGAPPVARVVGSGHRRLVRRRGVQLACIAGMASVVAVGGGLIRPDAISSGPVATSPSVERSSPPAGHSPKLLGRPATALDLAWRWHPITLLGKRLTTLWGADGLLIYVSFASENKLTGVRGYDGCNWLDGHLAIQPDGTITRVEIISTARGCFRETGGYPYTEGQVLDQATQARLFQDRLLLYDGQRLLGSFAHAIVHG